MAGSATYRFIGISFMAVCFAIMFQRQAFSQSVPQRFSYQAVIRDGANQLLNNQSVGIRLGILQGSETGNAVYVETHTASTSTNGLLSLQVGGGTVVSGALAQIDWASGPYFIKTETDPLGGNNYSITGTSQMLSVPYALFSANGTPGPQGPAGLTGPAGTTGASGSNGKNALIRTTPEAAGTNCANGGVKIEAGLDADANGTLSDSEVNASQTKFLCNGATGAQGPAGSGGFVHYPGEQFGGGVVFHVYKDGSGAEHGLIVALTNQSDSQIWSNVTDTLAGATSILNGLPNSNAIIALAGHTNSAAKLCLDYEAGGFTDWYLPAKYELNLLYGNIYNVNKSLTSILGATEIFPSNNTGYYWSSSEVNSGYAWYLYYGGAIDFGGKGFVSQVRAVRAF